VPNRQPLGYRILALENVNVGSADGRGGDSDQGVLRADIGDRFVFENDAPFLNENGGFHLLAHSFLTLLLLIAGAPFPVRGSVLRRIFRPQAVYQSIIGNEIRYVRDRGCLRLCMN
jgi:hypothetical protein